MLHTCLMVVIFLSCVVVLDPALRAERISKTEKKKRLGHRTVDFTYGLLIILACVSSIAVGYPDYLIAIALAFCFVTLLTVYRKRVAKKSKTSHLRRI